MTNQEQLESLETYFNLMTVNGSAEVFHIANKFNIFKALENNLKSPKEIADFCNIKEKPLKLVLEVLCTMKVLEKIDTDYHLSTVMKLLAGNYQDLGGSYWKHLPELLKTEKPLVSMDDKKFSENLYKSQVTALDWMMKPSAEVASTILEIGSTRKKLNILDIGAGSGIWSLTFAKKDPSSIVTAVDWPTILDLTTNYAQEAGLKDRFQTMAGNYHDLEFPSNAFDMIILGNVTHIEKPETNTSLFKKLNLTLKENGELIIFDIFPGQSNGDIQRSLYTLGLALRTDNGTVYSPEELQDFLKKADFKSFNISTIPILPYTMGMLIAKKS